jgi:stage III sporulation protein AF
MHILTSWITNIILFVLLAIVLELLLPNSVFQKYVKMVIGLLLIVIILSPMLKVLTGDFDKMLATIGNSQAVQEKNIENFIESKKSEIQARQHAYILEQMAVQMKTAIEEELVQEYGLSVVDIKLNVEQDKHGSLQNLKEVFVVLGEKKEDVSAVEVVKTVKIDTKQPTRKKEQQKVEGYEKIQNYLAYRWGLTNDQVVISFEGGRSN